MKRRDLLRAGAIGGATLLVGHQSSASPRSGGEATPATTQTAELEPLDATIADLQQAMVRGELTARRLVDWYTARIQAIDFDGPRLRSILEVNPEAKAIADQLDAERRAGRVRGPLHGIPVVLKDNIDTGDSMQTSAGSLALVGAPAERDAHLSARLREAGAVILGKANLSEWANFRSTRSSSGWSGRGGQTRNPHVLDRSPCGSSAGSGAAVAAGLCTVAVGTETDGSIVCPSSANGIVGIKPTLGLVSRSGIIPIAHSQDTAGPMARTVADAAALLGVLAGPDTRDPASAAAAGHRHDQYDRFLLVSGLQGARIGLATDTLGFHDRVDALIADAVNALRESGAEVIEMELGLADEVSPAEWLVLQYEFKADIEAYLSTRPSQPHRTLADLIAFNEEHADEEMPFFGQEIFHLSADKGPLSEPAYLEALATAKRLAGPEGIDRALEAHRIDAIIAPTGSPAWAIDLVVGDHFLGGSSTAAAVAGYPAITVPCGLVHGLPVGLSFFGGAWSDPQLIRFAYAFEQATQHRRPPTYLRTIGG